MLTQERIQLKLIPLSKLLKEILHFTQELSVMHMSDRSNLFLIFQHATLSKGPMTPQRS